MIVIGTYAFLNIDPLVKLFFWVGMLGGFGVLLLVTVTSVAVIAYFAKNPGRRERHHPVPRSGGVGDPARRHVGGRLHQLRHAAGRAADRQRAWYILPALYLLAILLGIIWAATLRVSNRRAYESIGLGANAATGRSFSDADLNPPTSAPTGAGW